MRDSSDKDKEQQQYRCGSLSFIPFWWQMPPTTMPSAFLMTPEGFEAGAATTDEKRKVRNLSHLPALSLPATEATAAATAAGSSGTFSKNRARFFLHQTRAGTGIGHIRSSAVSMSLGGVSSAGGGAGASGGDGSVFGDEEDADGERRDIIVGAEGAFPVGIGFVGEWGGSGVDVQGGYQWVEGGDVYINKESGENDMEVDRIGEKQPRAEIEAERVGDEEEAGRLALVDPGSDGDVKFEAMHARAQETLVAPAHLGRKIDELGGAREADGLGSWVADFGLLVAGERRADGEAEGWAGRDDGGVWSESLTGWGFVDEEGSPDMVSGASREESGRRNGAGAWQGDAPVRVASSQRVMEEIERSDEVRGLNVGSPTDLADSKEPERGHTRAVHGVSQEPTGGVTKLPDDVSAPTEMEVGGAIGGVSAERTLSHEAVIATADARATPLRDDADLSANEVEPETDGVTVSSARHRQRASGNKRTNIIGFFDSLRRLGTDAGGGTREGLRAKEALQAAVRTAGGELYGLRDRLDELVVTIQRWPSISNGRGGDAAAAAAEVVVATRTLLRRAYDEIGGGALVGVIKPEDIRRAARVAERRVREAERVVREDVASFDNAEARRALALAALSACRSDFDQARTRLRDTPNREEPADDAAVSLALGEAQASVDAATDRLQQPLPTVPAQRRGRPEPGTMDAQYVDECRTSVNAFIGTVDEYCTRQNPGDSTEVRPSTAPARRKPGERLVMQARALRRAMLGPAGVSGKIRRGYGEHGSAFRTALEKLDAALAEADRLANGIGGGQVYGVSGGNDDDDEAFIKAAEQASRAAQELQQAGEVGANQEGARAERARTLVRLALIELGELEGDVETSGLDSERSVVAALRVARRGLEDVALKLGGKAIGDEPEATTRSAREREDRVLALVASGKLESALGTVDEARAEIVRVSKVFDLEAKAKTILEEERRRVDVLSQEAETLGLVRRPAVVQALQGCRSAALSGERCATRSNTLSVEELQAFAEGYMKAALDAAESRGRAEEVLTLERSAAERNDQEMAHLAERLDPAMATLSHWRDRLEQLSAAAKERCGSLEEARLEAASWDIGQVTGKVFSLSGCPLSQEPDGALAARAVARVMSSVETLAAEAKYSWDVGGLSEKVNISLQRVAVTEAVVAEAEMRGRRRDRAAAGLSRAVVKTKSVIHNARAAKLEQRAAVADSLVAAARDIFDAFSAAADTARASARLSSRPGEARKGDNDGLLLDAAGRAEEAAESAADVLAKERYTVEQKERERQEAASELWSAARRLEELDTEGVVGDDPETAAMVLEARSEVVQILVALEAAQDPTPHLAAAQTALEHAFASEDCFSEAQRKVRCFDNAASLLEQAEARVAEAEFAMKVGSVSSAGRVAFHEALKLYEDSLIGAASSDGGADAFLEACNAAFFSARDVEIAATRARRQVRARAERRRRELARLDRPAASLVALDLSELTAIGGETATRAVAAVRDALSAIRAAREEVAEGRQDEGEAAEAALAERVEQAVQAASVAESAFRKARDRARKAERWQQELARPRATLARVEEELRALPDAELVFELCSASVGEAEVALKTARDAVFAFGAGDRRVADTQALVEASRDKANEAQRGATEQATRVKAAASKRRMLASALVASTDALVQAQASLDADEEVRSSGDIGDVTRGATGGAVAEDLMSDALRTCVEAERAANVAHELLEKPLTSSWLNAAARYGNVDSSGDGTSCLEIEERAVEEAQQAVTAAEEAVAHLTERLGQLRGIRAKLRSLLAAVEARFRRASAALADAGALSNTNGVENALQVASSALARARERLQSPLSSGYLLPGGGNGGGGDDTSGGAGRVSLARDEEAVSNAAGYVAVLESLADSAVGKAGAKDQGGVSVDSGTEAGTGGGAAQSRDDPSVTSSSSLNDSQRTAQEALALALQWGDTLRAQVANLQLTDYPAVEKAAEAAEAAMGAAQEFWVAASSGGQQTSGEKMRAGLEALATELGRLEKVAEVAAEQKRAREAGVGAAAKRLERLMTTLGALDDKVRMAGQPLVSLTAEAIRTAADATNAASAAAAASGVASPVSADAANSGPTSRRPSLLLTGSPGAQVFASAVQEAAVAVAQAEATVTRAQERAFQLSAERVRALETLVELAEALSAAGDRLALSSVERGLSASREAAATISDAQAALGRARAAAQVDAGVWLSSAAAIADAVATAGDFVRRAERAADGPAVVRPTMTAMGGENVLGEAGRAGATAVAEAEAKARAWLDADTNCVDSEQQTSSPSPEEEAVGLESINTAARQATPAKLKGKRTPRIGFSDGGEAAPTYMPLWMRLQNKAWELGGSAMSWSGWSEDSAGAGSGATPGTDLGLAAPPQPEATQVDSTSESADVVMGEEKRRAAEEERLRAEARRLRAEAARLRQARGVRSGGSGGSNKRSSSGDSSDVGTSRRPGEGAGGSEPRSFKKAAEELAEELVKDFAARAKAEAQRTVEERRRSARDKSDD